MHRSRWLDNAVTRAAATEGKAPTSLQRTLPTDQLEILELNATANEKSPCIVVTPDTFQPSKS